LSAKIDTETPRNTLESVTTSLTNAYDSTDRSTRLGSSYWACTRNSRTRTLPNTKDGRNTPLALSCHKDNTMKTA
jgi:hypothetical protein